MLSPSSVNLGCSWNSLTRNLTSPDSRILSSVRDAAASSDNGAQSFALQEKVIVVALLICCTGWDGLRERLAGKLR